MSPSVRGPVYETVYSCGVIDSDAGVEFRADARSVGWVERKDGAIIQGHLSLHGEADAARFQHSGFKDWQFDQPIIFFEYPTNLKPDTSNGFTIEDRSVNDFYGGARGGDATMQEHATSNVFFSLNWRDVQRLEVGGKPVSVFLYDAERKPYLTLTFAAAHFAQIEQKLRAAHAAAITNEADREHRCKKETHEVFDDIISVH